MAKTAFVTGGTGFIGLNLVELLVREGWDVTALHRPTSNLRYLNRFPIELTEGSITEPESLARGIPQGTDVVFHVAGDTSFWSKQNTRQNAINIDGTRNVVEAAISRGVGTLVHTSSISAWGRVSGTITEETPMLGKDSWINYERSKHLGELEALKGMDRGMKVVVMNPAVVAGPYDATTWGRLFFLLRDNALPAAPPGTITVGHVHEVVAAHLAAVTKGANGERYILGGPEIDTADFIAEIARVSGVEKVPKKAPGFVLKLFGRLSVMAAAWTGKEPDVTPETAEVTSQTGTHFSSEKAMRELGYGSRPVEVAVKDNYEWLVEEGLLAPLA
jgi:nucleoside-diphosphate-sugar epimerase